MKIDKIITTKKIVSVEIELPCYTKKTDSIGTTCYHIKNDYLAVSVYYS